MSKGFTLFELVVAVSIIACLVAVAIPAFSSLRASYESSCTLPTLESALNSARAIAIKEQKVAGIRFQQYGGKQYLYYIIRSQDDANSINDPAIPFCLVNGIKPICLGSQIGIAVPEVTKGNLIDENTTKCTVLFSPSGRLVIKNIFIRSRTSEDTVFGKNGIFPEEKTGAASCMALAIYDQKKWKECVSTSGMQDDTDYVKSLKQHFINTYSGELLN